MAFSADDRLLALVNVEDGRINIIETSTGKVRQSLGNVRKPAEDMLVFNFLSLFNSQLAFSPDSKLLASWSPETNVVRIWDLATGKERLQIIDNEQRNNTVTFAWSPDGRMLVLAGFADRGKIQLWEVATRKIRREFAGHEGDVRALAFSPDGKLLASGSADTTVLIWDVWGR